MSEKTMKPAADWQPVRRVLEQDLQEDAQDHGGGQLQAPGWGHDIVVKGRQGREAQHQRGL